MLGQAQRCDSVSPAILGRVWETHKPDKPLSVKAAYFHLPDITTHGMAESIQMVRNALRPKGAAWVVLGSSKEINVEQ